MIESMKAILKPRILGMFFGLLFLCSCATIHPPLPADVPMNKGAGRGDELFLTLHLADGQELLFIVDTGGNGVLLDKSLEPKLGRCLRTSNISPGYGMKTQSLYRAPKLYLGNTQLRTGGWICTADLSGFSHQLALTVHTNYPIMGVLGMSCLKHYCVQLDFAARKLRFLDAEHSDKHNWGKPFQLVDHRDRFWVDENLVGVKGPSSLIDTGCYYDGWLTPQLFQEWTNHVKPPAVGEARSSNGVLGGDNYPDINLGGREQFNDIGLYFLARHLVTFDFSHRTMYLKRTSIGPLIDEDTKAARDFLKSLRANNELPGCSKDDKWLMSVLGYPVSDVLDVWRNGDPTSYHYMVIRDAKDGSLRLQKAWRTDAKGNVIENYPVP